MRRAIAEAVRRIERLDDEASFQRLQSELALLGEEGEMFSLMDIPPPLGPRGVSSESIAPFRDRD